MVEVKIITNEGARHPEYQSNGAAGADLFASVTDPVTINPGSTVLIPTGLYMEIQEGYEAQIRPRSGLALKNGLTLLNSPGTIDSDYRGEVKIIVTNLGAEPFTVTDGMRIAQVVFSRVYRGNFIRVEELNSTVRDDGGFGHSGV